jgi:hypothetical protein
VSSARAKPFQDSVESGGQRQTVVAHSHRAFGTSAFDVALDGLMMQSERTESSSGQLSARAHLQATT